MPIQTRKRLLLAVALPLLALAVGGAAFAITRQVSSESNARADAPEFGPTPPVGNQTPEWFVGPEQTRSAAPKLAEQVINGIHVGTNVRRRGGPCDQLPKDSSQIQTRAYAAAQGTPLEITPRYLPTGTLEETSETFSNTVFCSGSLAHAQRRFQVPADRATGRLGGYLIIARSVGDPYENVALPAKDFRPGSIAGHNAVLVSPTTPEGFGQAIIVVAETWGITTISSTGLRLEELQRIAEGLY